MASVSAFDGVNPRVNAADVNLLDAVGVAHPRHTDINLGSTLQCATIFAGQRQNAHVQSLGFFGSGKDIGGMPAGADGEQHVALLGQELRFDGQTRVRSRSRCRCKSRRKDRTTPHRGKWLAVLAVASTQFFREVHGVAHGSPVPTRHDFVSGVQAVNEHVPPHGPSPRETLRRGEGLGPRRALSSKWSRSFMESKMVFMRQT